MVLSLLVEIVIFFNYISSGDDIDEKSGEEKWIEKMKTLLRKWREKERKK